MSGKMYKSEDFGESWSSIVSDRIEGSPGYLSAQLMDVDQNGVLLLSAWFGLYTYQPAPHKSIVNVRIDPYNAGYAKGGQEYLNGQFAVLKAISEDDFIFESWTENDEVVSDSSTFVIEVKGDRDFTANFSLNTNVRQQSLDVEWVSVYPNPVEDKLVISNSSGKSVDGVILNSYGVQLRKFFVGSHSQKEFRINEYMPGCYFVKMNCNGYTVLKKIIKN